MDESERSRRAATRGARRLEGLLAEILLAPDRDRCPGARPIVSFTEQDEREYLDRVDHVARTKISLTRRGIGHGEWAELEPARLPPRARGPAATLAECSRRWHSAQPIVLAGIARTGLAEHEDEIARKDELHRELQEPGGLARWLDEIAADLDPPFTRIARRRPLADPERDIERSFFASEPPVGRGRKVDDLWVKSGWLSTHPDDDSLRVRVSFGRERDDDASTDLLRQRLVAELAERLFPEAALTSASPDIVGLLARLTSEPILLTQHIAYWNSVEGGALFHHDAFASDADVAGLGQLGVLYLQLSGRTAWLALPIATLAARVREFVEHLDDGALPWVRAQLFPTSSARARIDRVLADERATVLELALPGCGRLGPIVNRGPEFTAFLADAGHAYLLEAGDAIVLPNHGLARTAMHSVFCAGDATAYALSCAIRADRESALEIVADPARKPAHDREGEAGDLDIEPARARRPKRRRTRRP